MAHAVCICYTVHGMSRINCIPPHELHNKHLLAEYRELPRVFRLARNDAIIPEKYTLGKGHVTFFYNKLAYLYERQIQLYNEMLRRGYKPNFHPEDLLQWKEGREALWNTWTPDNNAIATNRARIAERLQEMQKKFDTSL